MYNLSQEQIFLFFFILGSILGFIFDFFKVLRKSIKTKDSITFVEDLLFLIISSFLIIYSIIKIAGGEIRFYLFLGIFLGILIYSLTISSLYVIILHIFISFIVNIFNTLFHFFKNILKKSIVFFKPLKNILLEKIKFKIQINKNNGDNIR